MVFDATRLRPLTHKATAKAARARATCVPVRSSRYTDGVSSLPDAHYYDPTRVVISVFHVARRGACSRSVSVFSLGSATTKFLFAPSANERFLLFNPVPFVYICCVCVGVLLCICLKFGGRKREREAQRLSAKGTDWNIYRVLFRISFHFCGVFFYREKKLLAEKSYREIALPTFPCEFYLGPRFR